MSSPPLPARDLDEVLDRTRPLWERARGQRIFITGGTGFFGRWLLESFAHANRTLTLGAEAVVLSRDPDAFLRSAPHLRGASGLTFVQGDVRSFDFPAGEFRFVIAGATATSAKLDPEEMFDTVVEGTRRTLRLAATRGAKRLLFVSSGAVYGPQPSDIANVPEEHRGGPDPLDPNSSYGEGKRAAELLCAAYARRHGFDAAIARCFAFVGPLLPLDVHFAIGNFIRDALAGRPIQIKGDGTPYRSYLYASDLAIWLWTLLYSAPGARPFNVGSPEGMPLGEVARVVASCVEPAIEVQIAKQADPSRRPERYVPATQRAEQELGLSVTVPLREAVLRTIAWHRGAR